MRLAILILALSASIATAQQPRATVQPPVVQQPAGPPQFCDLAPEYRQRNYGPSCGHASLISPLRWVQEFNKADWWRENYSGPENANRSYSRLKKAGINCLATFDGDLRLINYATESRRMVAVYDAPRHVRTYCGQKMHKGRLCAVILDNNRVKQFYFIPWGEWVSRWRSLGGCAIVILDGQVPPPVPE